MSSGDSAKAPTSFADWREPAHYLHLLDVDRAGWAWEWLRRNPAYEGIAPGDMPESRQLGRASVTVIPSVDDKEGSRWGLTFR